MKHPGIFTILWNFIRSLWDWHCRKRQTEEQEVQERAADLAREQQAAQAELIEQEKAIDQRVQEQQVQTDPDTVVADLNDIFRGELRLGEPGDQQG